MSIVSNVKVYDLEESIIASGYPMRTIAEMRPVEEKDIKRCVNLSNACNTGNGAHGQYLTGIRVAFDLKFSNKAWVEAERYHWFDFVSSQSTMHRITRFDLDETYIEYVDPRIIEIMKEKVAEYNRIDFEWKTGLTPQSVEIQKEHAEEMKRRYLEILYSNPCGFKLTAGMTTNYQQLKTIYGQRKNHRLPEWVDFCKWIETLPMFKELCLGGEVDE